MPAGNRTGPNGLGPMTGRGAGFCAGNDKPGYLSPGVGGGRGAYIFSNGRNRRRQALLLTGLASGCAYIAYRFANRNGK